MFRQREGTRCPLPHTHTNTHRLTCAQSHTNKATHTHIGTLSVPFGSYEEIMVCEMLQDKDGEVSGGQPLWNDEMRSERRTEEEKWQIRY